MSDLSWNTSDGIKVVICNNNKNSYYKDPIGGTVFIRKDYLDKYLESHTLKYFAFTERFIQKQDMPMRLHCILKFKMEIL